ncbi:MAG: Mono(2-hydroxyethyl) terephthalate hydrolase [Stenotrophomonas maltophilia]|nr:MAG: Mono(2-hydroxyethyl) terephthalate hydrolase [Stenotrophomonas maltophilia]
MPASSLRSSLLGLFALLAAPALALAAIPAPAPAPLAELPAIRPVSDCASLAALDLSDIGGAGSHISSAKLATEKDHEVCAVQGNLAPSIGFQVQLPTQGWTQRYLQVGCGGLCGRISLQAGAAQGCEPLNAGAFVVAGSDMGHSGEDDSWGADPQKRADFAHRGVHLTALAAKKLIQAFYGQPQAYAYFTGCSDGGREALMEAQRYPGDFNGIIAGAAALNFQVQNSVYHAWQTRANTGADGQAILVAGRLPLLHEAVLKACDGLDGQVDRLISDPRACHFDPAVLQCANGEAGQDCLSAAEVGAVRRLYDGPRDPVSGQRLTIGGPQYASELAWAGVFVPNAADQPIFSGRIALQAIQGVSLPLGQGQDISLEQVSFDKAWFDRLRSLHALYDASNPDLSAYAKRGGKLIIWHGWADPHISPLNSIAYHEALERQLGSKRVASFERLYLLPGVHHCNGGEGPDQLDLLTPMMSWVERDQAPQAIIATQAKAQGPGEFGAPEGRPALPPPGADGKLPGPPPGLDGQHAGPPPGMQPLPQSPADAANAGRSRPLYPYPYVAVYQGHGDIREASSYRRGQPQVTTPTPNWLGQDFFLPYSFLER